MDELGIMTHRYDPVAFCLQEVMLPENGAINIRRFSNYIKLPNNNDRPSGGVAILVPSNTPHSRIRLYTNLQAVAIRVSLHKTITLCSLYLPPNSAVEKHELQDLLRQLPRPAVVCGDFNAHNPLWWSSHITPRGKIIEDLIAEEDFSLLNDGSATYIHPANGSQSNIDLTICHPNIYLDLKWNTVKDTHGSDHYPVLVSFAKPHKQEKLPQ